MTDDPRSIFELPTYAPKANQKYYVTATFIFELPTNAPKLTKYNVSATFDFELPTYAPKVRKI